MTDKILIDRSVLEQALEALDQATAYTSSESWSPSMTEECLTAATHLRAALEQPQVEQEPVAYGLFRKDSSEIDWDADHVFSNEPWGVMYDDEEVRPLYVHQQNLNCKSNQARLATLWGYVKEQPKREPLSDEQIDEMWREATLKPALTSEFVHAFARAIERAHGIGGEK